MWPDFQVQGLQDTKDGKMGRFLWRKAGNINTEFLGKISYNSWIFMQIIFLNIGASQPNSIDFEIISISPVAPEKDCSWVTL